MPDETFSLNRDAVKRILRLQGYSQNGLAQAAGKDPSEVSLWVNAKRRISLPNAKDLATVLRCTVNQLRGFEPFTPLDLTKQMPPIGTAQRYLNAIQGKWHAKSIIHFPTDIAGHNTIDNMFEWDVDLTANNAILTGETVCITPGSEQASYMLHLEPTGVGIILVDGFRDAIDGATDLFRGILQFHSDTKTITMNGKVIVHWPVLQQICFCDLEMHKLS